MPGTEHLLKLLACSSEYFEYSWLMHPLEVLMYPVFTSVFV